MIKHIETIKGIRSTIESHRAKGCTIGFVPTMGAFHAGHVSLMRAAKKETDKVVVSVFVNPLQFSAGEDYDRYPRQPEADTQIAAAEGVDIFFTPSVAEMYPKGFCTYIDEDNLPGKLCGQFRPGHFRGVMSVVCKLFQIVRPDVAYFGQKDYQQALITRRMVTDLNIPVQTRIMPTVRDEDGLAMSSRNIYLGPKQRKDAAYIYRAMQKAEEMIGVSESSAARVIREMKRMINKIKGVRIDYLAIVNQETLEPVKEIKGKTLVAVAVRIGNTRLIDNVLIN